MRLSAALIVKNEEAFLKPCLVALQGIVDEIVVVDSGSTDRTREIATQCGASLHAFRCCAKRSKRIQARQPENDPGRAAGSCSGVRLPLEKTGRGIQACARRARDYGA